MPALSKKQQKFMGIVRSIQKGEQPASKFSKDAQDVAKDMKKKDVKKFASTKHKGLPMKKEVLNKLKEMIKQELSEYTYGVGDVVKDVNPTCPHYGAKGKVKSVNPRSVVFVVMNKGKNFKPGMELEKSHDQMKKMNEGSMDWEKKHFPWANKKEQMMIAKLVFSNKDGIDGEVKRQKKNPSSYKNHIKRMVKKGLHESVNEFSMKLQKSTQDMVDALLKVKSPMPKEIESALIMMAKGYGLDYVKKQVKKDPKGFYKNLKQMAAAFPEFRNKPKDYKFESIIQERNDEVQTGKEYTKLWLQSIGLVIKQANSLKGALSKHPIKRDLNKLKAVENLFKKFIKPAIEKIRANDRHYAPNQTELRKYLSDSKFKIAVRILKQTLQSSNGYNENSWYNLDDKTTKLIEKMSKVLYDIENKMDKANLESVNEDGHTDVASSKRKVMIMVDDANKLLNKLNGMNKEDSLPSWWSDKITLSQNYLQKATNYLLNPVESVNEGKGVDKIMKMADDYSYGKIAGKTVDVMTAKLFQAAYNKAPQKAKDKVDKMNEKQLYIFMMNLWKRFGKQVRLGS